MSGNNKREVILSPEESGLGRRKYMAIVGTLGSAGLAGCGGQSGGGDGGSGGDGTDDSGSTSDGSGSSSGDGTTLRVGIRDTIEGVDSGLANLTMDFYAIDNMLETLFTVNENAEIVSELATGVEIEDGGRRWIFPLREDAMFHPPVDRPMTAEDVIANFDRVNNPDVGSPRREFLQPLENWSAVDENTVQFDFGDDPNAGLLGVVQQRGFQINARETLDGGNQITEPVGTGPFQFVEWVSREQATLERFEDHWNDEWPGVDRLEIVPRTEPSVRATELRNGEIDIDQHAARQLAPSYENNDDIELVASETTLGRRNLVINTTQNETDNRPEVRPIPVTQHDIRLAIEAAIDREAMLQAVDNGFGQISHTLYPSSNPFGPDYQPFEFGPRPERARELIEESQYSNPPIVVITRTGSKAERQIGQLLESQLSNVGFDVDLQETDTGIWLEKLTEQRYDIRPGEGAMPPDPAPFLNGRYMQESDIAPYFGGENNNHEQVFDAWSQANAEADQERRVELYKEAQRLIADDAAYMMCWHNDFLTAHRSDVEGVKSFPQLRGQSYYEVSK